MHRVMLPVALSALFLLGCSTGAGGKRIDSANRTALQRGNQIVTMLAAWDSEPKEWLLISDYRAVSGALVNGSRWLSFINGTLDEVSRQTVEEDKEMITDRSPGTLRQHQERYSNATSKRLRWTWEIFSTNTNPAGLSWKDLGLRRVAGESLHLYRAHVTQGCARQSDCVFTSATAVVGLTADARLRFELLENPAPHLSRWQEKSGAAPHGQDRLLASAKAAGMSDENWQLLQEEIIACRACPRLVQWREQVAREKVRRHKDEAYWGKPLPGFGDPAARLLILGLAPGAHGANRTGRMFTGDDSGKWLYEALHRYGFANQPTSTHRDDGLRLRSAYISNVCRCVPPDNKPLPSELAACRGFLLRELHLLQEVQVVLCLGKIAFDAYLRCRRELSIDVSAAHFSHGAEYPPAGPGDPWLLASYHPSRQNTNTGKLTWPMWHAVFARARELVGP